MVVQEGWQKNFGSIGIRNGEHKHPDVVVPEGWQRNNGVVNKGKEIILEFQNLKIPNSSGNLYDLSNDLLGKETAGFGAEVTLVINDIVTNGFKGKVTLDICFRVEREYEGKWGVIFSEVKEVGLKPSGQPALTKELAPARENRPILKPARKPGGRFMGRIGSFQKPKV